MRNLWESVYICVLALASAYSAKPPNIIILFADDLGYGDLPSYGHPTSQAPNLVNLAANGLRFTQFYSASSVCSPSRASLLTGRQPPRTGVYPGVFFPDSSGGLPLSETTIAEILKPLNYSTAIIGKWHLGVGKDQMYLPTNQGFDFYYGIPYSHSQCPCLKCFYPSDPCDMNCMPQFTACPLFKDTQIIEQPTDLTTLSTRFSQEAKSWIGKQVAADKPFLLYYAFHQTHNPMFAGQKFRNATQRGPFGDMLAELDWLVGEVIEGLKEQGIAQETFVFFTSDNGPQLAGIPSGTGNAGLLKCGKGTTYEGGQRVPAIAHWPGRITPGVTTELASTLDLLPTIAKITGAKLSKVPLDGFDMSPVLFENDQSLRDSIFYYPPNAAQTTGLYAIRYQQYKAHFYTAGNAASGLLNHDADCRPFSSQKSHDPPLVYDLDQDASEQNRLNTYPHADMVTQLKQLKDEYDTSMTWAESEILKPQNTALEPCCNPECTPKPQCCTCKGNTTPVFWKDLP